MCVCERERERERERELAYVSSLRTIGASNSKDPYQYTLNREPFITSSYVCMVSVLKSCMGNVNRFSNVFQWLFIWFIY